MDIQVIFKVMLKLFLIMALGFGLAKTGYIDKHTNSKLSGLISRFTMPLLVLSSVLSASSDSRLSAIVVLGSGIIMYLVFILFGKLITLILPFPKESRTIYECMLVFSNNSFMGYPVIQSILGNEAIFYTAMVHFAFNLFIFSYGVNCVAKTGGEKKSLTESMKNLINPGFIMVVFALLVFVTGIRDNGIVYETVSMVGNVTSPLSMIVLGASLAMYPLKDSISDWRSYLYSFVRLIVIPVITSLVCKLLGINEFFTTIVVVTNAMPAASMVLMLANEAGTDTKIIIRNIFVSTILSTITVPVMVSLLL